jgi:hypothetical protein
VNTFKTPLAATCKGFKFSDAQSYVYGVTRSLLMRLHINFEDFASNTIAEGLIPPCYKTSLHRAIECFLNSLYSRRFFGDDSFDLGGLLHLDLKIFQCNLS